MTRAQSLRCLGAGLWIALFATLSACGHYGPPLRVLPPPPGSPPGTPEAAVPELPPQAVPPPSHTPTPLDDTEGWTP